MSQFFPPPPNFLDKGAEYVEVKSIGKEPLILVDFSNGHLKKSKNSRISFKRYKSEKKLCIAKIPNILVANAGKSQYTSLNSNRDTAKTYSCRPMLEVAIVNKATHKMGLYNADYFHFKPLIEYKIKNESVDTVGKTYMEKADNLTAAFGSKNKRKAAQSRLKYAPKESNLNSVVDMIDASILDDLTKSQNPIKCEEKNETIPPQNKSATSVTEIYNIDDIISQEEYDAIGSEENIFLSASREDILKWKDDEIYCEFIINCLGSNLRFLTTRNARLLRYLNYMVCFLKLGYKDFRKKDFIPNVPEPFKRSLTERFVSSNLSDSNKLTWSMPLKMKDKLIAYSLVLALTIDNFNVDATLLASSFKTPLSRLTNIAYALGCHVHKKKNETSKIIELKLPLYEHRESTFRFKKK